MEDGKDHNNTNHQKSEPTYLSLLHLLGFRSQQRGLTTTRSSLTCRRQHTWVRFTCTAKIKQTCFPNRLSPALLIESSSGSHLTQSKSQSSTVISRTHIICPSIPTPILLLQFIPFQPHWVPLKILNPLVSPNLSSFQLEQHYSQKGEERQQDQHLQPAQISRDQGIGPSWQQRQDNGLHAPRSCCRGRPVLFP